MKEYVRGILSQGNCPALVKGGVFRTGDEDRLAWEKSGLMDVRQALKAEILRGGCSSAKAFLKISVLIAAAVSEAEDWLIAQEDLDFSTGNVWYSPSERRVQFCLAGEDGGSLFELLYQLADLQAPEALPYIEKLGKKAKEENLSPAAIKKELSLRLTGPG